MVEYLYMFYVMYTEKCIASFQAGGGEIPSSFDLCYLQGPLLAEAVLPSTAERLFSHSTFYL